MPPEYIEYKYREKFHLSKTEFDKQPLQTVLIDLKMMQIESEYNAQHGRT